MEERKLEVLTKEFVDAQKGLYKEITAVLGIDDLLEEADDDMLILAIKLYKLLGKANEIVMVQASLLCDMNEKLDHLIEKNEEA